VSALHTQQPTRHKGQLILRDYQTVLFTDSLDSNRIIYLPTGQGKTIVSIASMYYYLCRDSEKKIVFLANTIQLVKQQADSIRRNLEKIMDNEEQATALSAGCHTKVRWDSVEARTKVCCIHGEKLEETGWTMRKRIEV
jgi:ERCC4-related helicase